MRAATYTFGCKQNQFETAGLVEILVREGYQVVPFQESADLYILNTCTVTGEADTQARQMIRRLHREQPGACLVVTGCYAQRSPGELAGMPGVDLVLGNNEKAALGDYLRETMARRGGFSEPRPAQVEVGDIMAVKQHDTLEVAELTGHTRAFVKVQDGCNLNCSYCVIPSVRGRSRSRPAEDVLRMVRNLVESGYQEIVLTGIHTGSWGRDFTPKAHLVDLLRQLERIDGLRQIRLSSLEPSEFTPELVEYIIEQPLICRHFHIPFQSGSPRILQAMHRPYKQEYYLRLLDRFYEQLPEVAIGGDLIVGFPGETDAEYAETEDFLLRYPFSYMHVFAYSDREGTVADALSDKVDGGVKRTRSRSLRAVARQKALEFRLPYVGREVRCLILARVEEDQQQVEAISDNYLRVRVDAPEELWNTYQTVRIEQAEFPFCTGRVV